jgi:hypothetical protein
MTEGDTQRSAHVRTRPIRVAFLVEHHEDSHPVLDAIFESCFQFWGGRFSLIVPCENGAPRPSFLPWLRSYDPDIIYSYVELSEAEQLRLHEDIYPSYLVRHRLLHNADKTEPRSWRPDLPIKPLGIVTLLPLLARRSRFGPPQPLRIATGLGQLQRSRFLADSFGTHDNMVEQRATSQLAGEVQIIAAAGDDVRPEHSRHITETVRSVEEMLMRLGNRPYATTYAQLSAILTPRPDMREYPWSQSFNVTIGDTVVDRLLFWNGRSLYPLWRDGDPVDLRVPSQLLANEAFCDALVAYLTGIPSVSGDNSGGSQNVTLRSSSVPLAELDAIRAKLTREKQWIGFRCDFANSVDRCVPARLDDQGWAYGISQVGGLQTGRWVDKLVTAGQWHLTSDIPEHLRHAPTSFQSEGEGLWAVDLDVERGEDNSPYDNVRDRWRLPRRLRMTGSFVGHYRLTDSHGPTLLPRVSRFGLLTLLAGGAGALPTIHEPTDHDVIVGGLTQGRDWTSFDRYDARPPAQLCYTAERSDAGRYFWGVYQLFGGLHPANTFLLNGFWRAQLAKFGATDQRPEQRLQAVRSRLRKKMPQKPFDLSDGPTLDRLADLVLQEADAIRLSTESISWDELRAAHEPLLQADWAANPGEEKDKEEVLEADRQSLAIAVQSLCERGVLHQGLEHRCRRCHHVSWIAISVLSPRVVCEVCKYSEPAPVDRAWDFRLNGFVREALRRHGVGPLFWTLSRLRPMTSASYWFEGPLGIYFTRESEGAGTRDTDIDLTVIAGDQVRMCEVKQSARGFDDPEKYAAQFMRLRPDIATIAIMEPPSNRIRGAFAKFEVALAGSGIIPELITFDPNRDIEDRAYLDELQSARLL